VFVMQSRLRWPHRSLAYLLCLGLAACSGTGAWQPMTQRPTLSVSAGSILAAPKGDPEVELQALGGDRSPAAMLRRAFLHLQRGRAQPAIDAAAEVLYGAGKPGADAEAFARYLRAEAYELAGKPRSAELDRARARALALDPDLLRRLGEAPVAAAPPKEDVPRATMAVQPRSSWSPQRPDRANLEPMASPYRLTIHHSAMYFRDTRPAACAAQIQAIQREHMQQRGYGDIGYHFLVDPSGRVWEGRELRWQGAHASGEHNIRNIGICLLGNFLRGRGGQGPTALQLAAMRELVQSLMQRYEIGNEAIHCHSDFKATECPGPLLEAAVAQLTRDLRRQGPRVASAGGP
jgi:hypothetical protein